MRRWRDISEKTRHEIGLAGFAGALFSSFVVVVFGMASLVSQADAHDRATRWSQIEKRYDVVVLDRKVTPPRRAASDPKPVAMRVAGQVRQCSVQVVGDEAMVFCGTDRVEAPRR